MEEVAVNELSVVPDRSGTIDGYGLFSDFFSLCAGYAKAVDRGTISIWSSLSIKDAILCGIAFGKWYAAHDRSTKELRQFALSLVVNQRAIENYPEENYPEYLYNDLSCQGLAAAAENELLCLSFLSADEWNISDVAITRRTLNESTADTVDERLSVHHASAINHLEEHRQWIETRTATIKLNQLQEILSAKEFWRRREELFPNLIFCESTSRQLEEIYLNPPELRGVLFKLRELNSVTGQWDTSKPFNHHQLRNATPESSSRAIRYQQQLTQLCPDGVSRTFVLHTRFTPGAGRLYFYPDQAHGRCFIGYIGPKIL